MGANAQTAVPVFTAGQVLTAAQVTQINTGIPVFATTTTRDSAFSGTGEKVLAEGQFAYIEASNTTQFYDGTNWLTLGGKIGQVVSTTKTDTFTTSSTTFVDITGMSVSITPTSTSSKVLILVNFTAAVNADIAVYFQQLRNSTAINIGDAAGSRTRVSAMLLAPNIYTYAPHNWQFLDSPATTSATTYKVQMAVNTDVGYINRTGNDSDSATRPRATGNITVMEILA